MLLIDSGAQYLGGTTDITRMWALGDTTPEQRRDVTLVLKGVIALSRCVARTWALSIRARASRQCSRNWTPVEFVAMQH